MERDEALARMPLTYAEAIRLLDQGRQDEIPAHFDIPPESVEPLLRLARAKLARMLDRTRGD